MVYFQYSSQYDHWTTKEFENWLSVKAAWKEYLAAYETYTPFPNRIKAVKAVRNLLYVEFGVKASLRDCLRFINTVAEHEMKF